VPSSGSGYGSGDGHGYGYSYGHGDDHGDGYGDGYSDGYGYGYGHGRGYGDSDGSSCGCGCGCGYGYGSGYGHGSGSGSGEYTVSHDTPVVAYHYVSRDGRLLREHNGERVMVGVGTVLDVDPDKLKMCRYGLHASLTPGDAAKHVGGATGHLLCKVGCSGRVIYGDDKLVCSRREVLEILSSSSEERI